MSEPQNPQYGPPPGYGTPPGYGPPPGYGTPPGYGPPPGYGTTPGYGPPLGYGPPYGGGYGPPQQQSWAAPPATWPFGPGRPGLATAAGVLGYVTAGLTIVFSLIMLLAVVSGGADLTMMVLLLGLPCSVGLITGSNQLLGRRSARNLFACAALTVGVLMVSLVIGLATLTQQELLGQAAFVVFAIPLPLLTAVFARGRSVTSWVDARGV